MSSVSSEPTDQIEQDSTEIVFSVAGSRQLGLEINKPAEQVCDFLSHMVARQPEDLLVHVQRIKLAARHGLKDYLRGALIDLLIALGPRGEELRKLMLAQAQAQEVLAEEELIELGEKMHGGMDPHAMVEDPGVSVLSKGIGGRTDLIETSALVEARHLGPLEQALASIEASQLADARDILESSVLAGTSDSIQQDLLLDLYRKTDDHVHFATLYANLEDDQIYSPEAWHTLQSYFDDRA